MLKDKWESQIPAEDQAAYYKKASEEFTDVHINRNQADELWQWEVCSAKAATFRAKKDEDEFHRWRGCAQQHLDRTFLLEQIKSERQTAKAMQTVAVASVMFVVVQAFFGAVKAAMTLPESWMPWLH